MGDQVFLNYENMSWIKMDIFLKVQLGVGDSKLDLVVTNTHVN